MAERIQAGVWKNKAGASLRVLWPVMTVREFRSLGGIWEAEGMEPLFGREAYLVTEDSLADAGYELIEPKGDEQ